MTVIDKFIFREVILPGNFTMRSRNRFVVLKEIEKAERQVSIGGQTRRQSDSVSGNETMPRRA